MKTRTCTWCRRDLPLNKKHFHPVKTKYFGGFVWGCRECMFKQNRATAKARYKVDPEYYIKHANDWTKKHPEKRAAHIKVASALKKGELVKLPCKVCKIPKVQAHHPDYTKPLEVVWLCGSHHRLLHTKEAMKKEV